MTRCERCDRPKSTDEQRKAVGQCTWLPDCTCMGGVCYGNTTDGCDAHRVDWRARALDAEAALATVAELAHLQAPIIERVTERADLAESIARRALVEGLAECERLRRFDEDASSRALYAACVERDDLRLKVSRMWIDWHATSGRGIALLESVLDAARSLSPQDRKLVEAAAYSPDMERTRATTSRAIRADATRAERERIVADARTAAAHARQEDGGAVSTAAETLEEFADWLERGDHAKGGG